MHKLQNSLTLWLGITVFATLVWIDPTGLGHMPVGGDATRFGLGLMSELTRAAGNLRVPLWNSLWGYGFPALAESQLGLFYPPHLVLYSCLPLEWAYGADRTLHALWAACGCWVLCRSLNRSAFASCLAAVVFVSSGFFLVHDTHHWAWPTTSWMPWIWWAMIRIVRPEPVSRVHRLNRATVLSLSAAMPVLTGHFQMSFIAMVSGFVLAAFFACLSESTEGPRATVTKRLWPLALVMLGVCFAVALSAVQILPTFELARIANDQRDWEYLSGFAAPPVHWLGLFVPGLGRRFAFWRPLVWDQFHTSPEELFFFVGLIPVWMAVFGAVRSWKLEPATRALLATLAVTTIFAAGPYGPGFSLAIRLPGFSFFRAPARWTAASTLIFALLAARGMDLLVNANVPPAKSFRRFFVFATAVSVMSIVCLEGLIRLSEGPVRSANPVLEGIDRVRGLTIPPWQDVGKWQDWVRRSAAVAPAPIPAYVKPYTNLDRQRFSTDRLSAYAEEAGPHLVLMAAAIVLSFVIRGSKRRMILVVLLLMASDAVIVRGYRSAELAPIRDVRTRSPVLARLGELSKDTTWPLAVAGDLGNLPMAVGGSPIRAYRTLDVPVMPQLEGAMLNPVEASNLGSLRLTGLGYAVIDPPAWQALRKSWRPEATIDEIDDPALWSWLTTSHVAARGPTTFAIVHLPGPRGRAWRIDESALPSLGITQPREATRVDRLERLAEAARPLDITRPIPELVRIEARTEGPELWVVSQWADPHWRATLASGSNTDEEIEILEMAGGWQGIRIPGGGDWKLTLRYEPMSYRVGAGISALAWAIALAAMAWSGLKARRARQKPDGITQDPVPL